MGKPKVPPPDPRIGEAAAATAQLGTDYLSWMKEQAAVTNGWATEDRARYQDTFIPLQDQFIKDAKNWGNPGRVGARVNEARAGTQQAIAQGQGQQQRQMAAMGVRPDSGRSAALSGATALQGGLAVAGAENTARRQVQAEAQQMQGQAINLGSGLALNPGQTMGQSVSTGAQGFQGAINAQGQAGSLYNTQFQQQMQGYEAQQAASASLWGGIGSIAGMAFDPLMALAFPSDRKKKTDIRKPGRSLLDAVDGMPVKSWSYKEGEGDGGSHVGTMSQDFQRETGMGDGKTINVIDAIGTLMGAVQELSAEVKGIKSRALPPESRSAQRTAPPRAAAPAPRPRSLAA